MTSGPQLEANIDTAQRLIAGAVGQGAKLILLPEYWPLMGLHEQDKTTLAQSSQAAQMLEFMALQASQHGIYLIGGTVPIMSSESG